MKETQEQLKNCEEECPDDIDPKVAQELEIIDRLNISSTNSRLDELYLNIVTMKKEEHSHVVYDPKVA